MRLTTKQKGRTVSRYLSHWGKKYVQELEIRVELSNRIHYRCARDRPSVPALQSTTRHGGMTLMVFDGLSLLNPDVSQIRVSQRNETIESA